MKTNQMRKAEAIYLGPVLARESTTITWVWQRLKGRQRSGNASEWRKGKASAVLCSEAAGMGELEAG